MVDSNTSAPTAAAVASGPCDSARAEVDSRCAEAERLAKAASTHLRRLVEARLQLAEITRQREFTAEVRDRRSLNAAKERARKAYRAAMSTATDESGVQVAAAAWLSEISRLNRQVRESERIGEVDSRRAAEIQGTLPGIELAADAARITAEAGRAACLEARRTLAACEEEAQQGVEVAELSQPRAARAAAVSGVVSTGDASRARTGPPAPSVAPLTLMLSGDRQTMLGLAQQLAEDTGIEAGRLQLLLLELREAIVTRALQEHALNFPPDHPFWGQLTPDDRRAVVDGLASRGFRYDGRNGWADGNSPTARDLTLALSHAGFDPRSLRRPAGQAAIDQLWQGTVVLSEGFLLARAPDMTVEQVNDLLGTGALGLGELWDNWGRLRPLLLGTASIRASVS